MLVRFLAAVSVILRFPRIKDLLGDLDFGDAWALLRDLDAYKVLLEGVEPLGILVGVCLVSILF